MQRDESGEALFAGGDGIREIKECENGVEAAATDEAVDGAAVVFRAEGCGRAAGFEIEIAGDEEEGIANGFDIEAAAVGVPEKTVVGVGSEICFIGFGAEGVGGGQHHFSVELFERPAFGDKTRG